MRSSGLRKKLLPKASRAKIDVLAAVLEAYAKRGVFRGFSRGVVDRRGAAFRIAWHWNRAFEFVFDHEKRALRCRDVLSNVPAGSVMYKELKGFVRSRHGEDLPEHRRIDRRKARVDVYNRGGNVSLILRVSRDECEYGTRKLIHLIQEIFMTFLTDGKYFDYVIETFDLDPDAL